MKRYGFWLKWVCATPVAVSALMFQGLGQGQTIESQDTRTFQDSRAQDGRQSPAVIPPGETERLKKLTEKAVLPEDAPPSAPSEAPESTTRDSDSPQRDIPTAKPE